MKLSEFKEYIINKFGRYKWEGIEDLSAYKYIQHQKKNNQKWYEIQELKLNT